MTGVNRVLRVAQRSLLNSQGDNLTLTAHLPQQHVLVVVDDDTNAPHGQSLGSTPFTPRNGGQRRGPRIRVPGIDYEVTLEATGHLVTGETPSAVTS